MAVMGENNSWEYRFCSAAFLARLVGKLPHAGIESMDFATGQDSDWRQFIAKRYFTPHRAPGLAARAVLPHNQINCAKLDRQQSCCKLPHEIAKK